MTLIVPLNMYNFKPSMRMKWDPRKWIADVAFYFILLHTYM